MTIYLDAVWLLNFLLDMMLLMLTQSLGREATSLKRILFGAFIASMLVPITLFYPDSFLTGFIGKVFYSLVIILCAFRFQSIYQTAKLLLLFYFTTFAIGGGLTGIHFMLQQPIAMSQNGVVTFDAGYGHPISWIFVLVGFPLIWKFTKNRMDRHAREKIRYDQIYPVTVQFNKQRFQTSGFIDSGNQLIDPLTKRPVIVCDEAFLMNWFTEEEWNLFRTAHEQLAFDSLPDKWERFIHVVPYQSVEGKRQFMLAIKPEKLIIHHDEKQIATSDVLIGMQFSYLTKDRSYHCLLQPEIMKLAAVHSA